MTNISPMRRHDPQTAFEAFVADDGASLLRLAVVSVADVHAGEDIYQETLQRLAANWARAEHPGAYARKVLANLVIDRHRALGRRPAERPLVDLLAVDHRSADSLAAAEVRAVLFAALDALTAGQRLTVALRFLEDRSEAEVASLTGVPVGTVKSITSRALARLRQDPTIRGLYATEAAG